MARLVITTPDGQQVVELRATNSLGRHPSNSVQVLDKIVSKEHCIIEQQGEGFILRDLGSLNGTFINRDRVQGQAPLKDGDEISMGSTRARFEAAAAPGAPAGALGQAAAGGWAAPNVQPAGAAPWSGQGGITAAGEGGYAQPPVGSPRPPPPTAAAPAPAVGPQPPLSGPSPSPVPPGPPPPRSVHPTGAIAHPSAIPSGRMPPPPRAAARAFHTAYLPQVARPTTVDDSDAACQIGAEISVEHHEFVPFERIASEADLLRRDYERLRLSYELSRDIATERDTPRLLEKILQSIFRFIPAQRGVIFLRDETGQMSPFASHRNDGSSDPISVSTTIMRKVVDDRKAVLTHDAAMDFAASKGKSMILNQIQSAIVAPMLYEDEILGVLWLDSKSLAQFQPKDLQLVTAVANQAAMFIEINLLGKQRERLSRFLSPNVREQVIGGEVDVKPGGTRTECTIYNSDIRGFTALSERTSPEEIVEMLNVYFEEMVEVIFKYEGTLDKFMGDGIMAFWGAPAAHSDDAERAVLCAREQTELLKEFNRNRVSKDRPPLGVGVGIDTGPVVAAFAGTEQTLGYTVIGDAANTSARLCARALAEQVIVSETTHAQLGPRFECEELPAAKIKGKDKPMRLWNVVRTHPLVQVPEAVEG